MKYLVVYSQKQELSNKKAGNDCFRQMKKKLYNALTKQLQKQIHPAIFLQPVGHSRIRFHVGVSTHITAGIFQYGRNQKIFHGHLVKHHRGQTGRDACQDNGPHDAPFRYRVIHDQILFDKMINTVFYPAINPVLIDNWKISVFHYAIVTFNQNQENHWKKRYISKGESFPYAQAGHSW